LTPPLPSPPAADMSAVRFMESYESRHSSHGFTAQVADALGISQAPLRMDSQCKYGELGNVAARPGLVGA